ncbi:pyridoxal 5'-phosphate synthase glutaminase subunit PdxT [Gulosibacter macacae]|uniref:Pyridoxal 5'-phosphate synthase subunit PdxT n=2 Tax=Gulosibacter macacae TaxID=2488791 RepID=A0A3P3W3D8_9MICO|nr:pyridoxal 5'-phosphate synthase glutaminase subunit PdxT [Gulosibacter macacae]RRJ87343.1 pyridoxal 5'-phosphate synthase glutaminase subunit PdxT [Gulosibacter macacae]
MTAPIGVLALQGGVREHEQMLASLGCEVRLIRKVGDLDGIAGLVLPGGESSVIDKLTRIFGIQEPIRELIRGGLPVFGTCAGLILLAERLADGIAGQQTFGGLDVTVRRNAFGSQLDSFETDLEVPALGPEPAHAVFIRAPIIESVGASVEVLASVGDEIVAARQGNLLGISFHPEVAGDARWHEYFLKIVAARN